MILQRYHWTPVVEFYTTFGVPVAWTPTVPEAERRVLRIRLILEELFELIEASGCEIRSEKTINLYAGVDYNDLAIYNKVGAESNITAAADALADLKYVVEGAALEWGIPLHACFLEVHASNMSKLGEDGRPVVREDGKVLKGPNFRLPDLPAVLERMKEEGAFVAGELANGGLL